MVIKISATIAAFLIVLIACQVGLAYTVNFAPKSHCGFGPMCPPPICMPASCAPMTCPPPQMGPRPIMKVKPGLCRQAYQPRGYPQMFTPPMGQPQPGLSQMYGWQ